MSNTLSSSWSLVKSSAKVLQADQELILFPILSSIAVILLSAVFFVPMFLSNVFPTIAQNGLQIIHYVILFVFYLLQYFIIFFCNSALVGAAMIRIRGGDPTLQDGLKIAFNHIIALFNYALIAATVGMLLSMIKERGNTFSKIVVSILGFVWNVATFLVVPILVVEDVGPVEAIKRSVNYLRKTWGEQLVGSFSISAIFNIMIIIFAIAGGAGFAFAIYLKTEIWVCAAILIITVLFILAVSLLNTTLTGIYTAAVYQYATTGDPGTYFETSVVQEAFHPSNKKTLL